MLTLSTHTKVGHGFVSLTSVCSGRGKTLVSMKKVVRPHYCIRVDSNSSHAVTMITIKHWTLDSRIAMVTVIQVTSGSSATICQFGPLAM